MPDEPATEPTPVATEAADAQSTLVISVGGTDLTATFASNSSAQALRELLAEGPLTVQMSDYGSMEKVGPLGTELPTNDERITTEPGDVILYQGGAFVIYYAPNTWSFTRLAKIDGMTGPALLDALGPGDVEVTLSLD